MTQAIRSLYQEPEKAQLMGQNARQWIVEHYSQDAVVTKYDEVIRKVAQGS
jgi:glycosyltransferase involved in cell wall biosynthesis